MTKRDQTEGSGEFDRLILNDRGGGIRMSVHVKPRSSRSAILGVRDGSLEVALTSPPADGAANGELCRLLAGALGVRQTGVEIATGASSRQKLIDVAGVTAADARSRLVGAKR